MNSLPKTKARRTRRYLLAAAVVIIILGASPMFLIGARVRTETAKTTFPSIDDVPRSHWDALAGKTIFFGHHSVGRNILAGIEQITAERPCIRLNIIRTCQPEQMDKPVLAHDSVGRNTDPASKIEHFRQIMESGVAEKADIAFFKFCFVDFPANSHPVKTFDDYKTLMQDLETRYDETAFLHVTVPITSPPRSLKGRCKEYVKLLIGRPLTGDLAANAARQHFNTMMRDACGDTDQLFDVAMIESINSAGCRCYSEKSGRRIEVLAPDNTDDGGHLNNLGSRKVAEQLLITLAGVASRRQAQTP